MKKIIALSSLFLLLSFASNYSFAQKESKDKNKETTFENSTPTCQGLPFDKRIRLSVPSFKVTAKGAEGQFGGELATMLSAALTNSQCFRVLQSAKQLGDATDELGLDQSGMTNGSTDPTGKMLNAQVLVTGEVTEYNVSSNSIGAFGLKAGGKETAIIGMIITMSNPSTREVYFQQSFNKESKVGKGSFKLFGVDLTQSSIKSPAVADACEKAIIDAVNYISSVKDKVPLPEANTGVAAVKKFDATNCTLLKAAYVPKIMVILPEYHIQRKIPDPAGETEINRKLIEAGFPVVDPAMFATLQNGTRFDEAAKSPMAAISLGREFGADIVIFGEAFSERVGNQNNMISCRARVEIRAVKTDDATIVATNGLDGGGVDLSEAVSSKTALKNAASNVADYMLEQFCSKNLTFSKTAVKPAAGNGKINSVTEITIQNATELSKWKPLADLLNSKYKILEKNSSNGTAYIRVEHEGTIDELADFIDSKLGTKYAVKDYGGGKMLVAVR